MLDDATGRWGLRVNRVEIKAIDPPKSIKDAMEKQMRAERDKRATVLSAEGQRQSQILTAEGDKQGAILRAEGQRAAAILAAEGQSSAIDQVFQAVHRNDPDPKVLAYQYLQMLPQLAQGDSNTFWVIPSEFTAALLRRAGVRRAAARGDRGRWEPPSDRARKARQRPPRARYQPESGRPNSRRPGSTSPSLTVRSLSTAAGGWVQPGSRSGPGDEPCITERVTRWSSSPSVSRWPPTGSPRDTQRPGCRPGTARPLPELLLDVT